MRVSLDLKDEWRCLHKYCEGIDTTLTMTEYNLKTTYSLGMGLQDIYVLMLVNRQEPLNIQICVDFLMIYFRQLNHL